MIPCFDSNQISPRARVISQPIRFSIALLATTITVLGMLGPTRAVAADSACTADVVFLMDNTGSMGSMISSTRSNATTILNAISGGDARFEGIDVQYGLATYWGDPLEYAGSSSSSYHCPTATEYSGRTNRFTVAETGTYWVDLIDTYGDGWHGNQLRIKRGSYTHKRTGSTFRWGRHKSGGKVDLNSGTTYTGRINPYSPYGWEIRWRICPVDAKKTVVPPSGYPAIARKAFKVNQEITDSKRKVISAMGEWATCSSPGGCGGDWPEANYFALHQLATEGGITDGKCEPGYSGTCTDRGYKTDDKIGWRDGTGKIIVWFGDAKSHCSTVSAKEALDALKTKNIVVAAINTHSAHNGIDYRANCDGSSATSGQATTITVETKGTLTNNVSGSSATVDAILEAVSKGIAQIGSAAAVSFSTGRLETSTLLFQSYFDASDWSGDLRAYQLDSTTGRVGSVVWKAADKLDARTPDSRVILTMGKDGVTSTGAPVPFRWDSLTTVQQRDLRTQHGTTKVETVSKGQARLKYLRGDRSNEGTAGHKFRLRGSVLGDIWHSSPIYYAQPSLRYPDTGKFDYGAGNLYSDFRRDNASRTGVVYVGSNDGMLHAFAVDTGEEILAYVPGNLYSSSRAGGYHQLTDPNFEHTSIYVDGTPYVADAFIRTRSKASESWRTVLIGTEGAGGRGLFALDVTDPSGFSESTPKETVLWEFSNADDAHLGQTFSRPTVALLNNRRWAVITGNGPEDTAVLPDSEAGDAQLFIIYLDGGLDGSWTEGTDYLRISTGIGTETKRNGLFTPALVDLDGNGTADRAYAGDLTGRMWAFDLESRYQSKWGITVGSSRPGVYPKPLFHAQSSAGVDQPITSQPEVMRHPTIKDGLFPNLMVLFGTGRFLDVADKTLTGKQSYYGVWDTDYLNYGRSRLRAAHLHRNGLAAQVFLVDDDSSRKRVLNPTITPDYHASKGAREFGWYFDLSGIGERAVGTPYVRGGVLHFNTIIPDTSICASGGTGWEMAVDTFNGGSSRKAAFDFNEDGVITLAGDTHTITTGEPPTSSTVGYAGRKVDADKGMPAGTSIVGDMRYTPGGATDEGSEIISTVLSEGGCEFCDKFIDRGQRISWQHLTSPQ